MTVTVISMPVASSLTSFESILSGTWVPLKEVPSLRTLRAISKALPVIFLLFAWKLSLWTSSSFPPVVVSIAVMTNCHRWCHSHVPQRPGHSGAQRGSLLRAFRGWKEGWARLKSLLEALRMNPSPGSLKVLTKQVPGGRRTEVPLCLAGQQSVFAPRGHPFLLVLSLQPCLSWRSQSLSHLPSATSLRLPRLTWAGESSLLFGVYD